MKHFFESFKRLDLKVHTSDYQGVWVEIKNKNSKNIICGCVYRHPRYDMSDFLNYIDSTLKKLNGENKEIFLMWGL